MTYMAHPTAVLKAFLQRERGLKPRMEFTLGRLSMALEMITVIRTLEDEVVPMLSLQRQEIISVLQTLLRDQDLAEVAVEWYEALTLWRQPSFEPDASREDTSDALRALRQLADAAASVGGGLQYARALAEGTRAQQDEHRSLDQALAESAQKLDEVEQSMRSELSESPDETDESRAEFLRQSRSHRGIGP